MYSRDELLKFSIYNTYEQYINPNLIYKTFDISLNFGENLFNLSKKTLRSFLKDKCLFNEEQIHKFINLFDIFLDDEIKKIYFDCEKNKITLSFYNYDNYPQTLLNIKKAPYVLYSKGIFNFNHLKTVALVGTRNISNEGRAFTTNIAKFLKENNFFNISGLALGVDTIGHIETLGQTAAVLAQGLLTEIYPKENKKLAEDILKNKGFLLSELPPHTNISVNKLIKRNRIQSGLSTAILIAETDIKGGTVHTFKYAKEQNKKIFIANFNKNFIEKYRKDLIIIKDKEDFFQKFKNIFSQKSLF